MYWTPLPKPAELAETNLICAILDGHFPIDSNLPAERELAAQLGVTRPTLREALQRLARDGWVEIRHGKPTRVRNYWREGSLGVLGAIARQSDHLPADFVPNLLAIRLLMAPAYTRLAVENSPQEVAETLQGCLGLPDRAETYAEADWQLHHSLTITSGNPVFTLILNGFSELYRPMACLYFAAPASRRYSQAFYAELLECALAKDGLQAEAVTRRVMKDSLTMWQVAVSGSKGLKGMK